MTLFACGVRERRLPARAAGAAAEQVHSPRFYGVSQAGSRYHCKYQTMTNAGQAASPPARNGKEHDMRKLVMAIAEKGVELEDFMDNYLVADADGRFVHYTDDLTPLEDPRDAALVKLDGKTCKEVADAYRADEDLRIADAVAYYEDYDEWDERMSYGQLLALLDAHMDATVRFVLYLSE